MSRILRGLRPATRLPHQKRPEGRQISQFNEIGPEPIPHAEMGGRSSHGIASPIASPPRRNPAAGSGLPSLFARGCGDLYPAAPARADASRASRAHHLHQARTSHGEAPDAAFLNVRRTVFRLELLRAGRETLTVEILLWLRRSSWIIQATPVIISMQTM